MDTIQFLYSIIGTPLGYILYFIYHFICSNVGIAILLFTLIIKLAMLPLSIKQQKNTAKSAIFAPKVREIQEKYRNNQEKQQEELAKLQQQGYNPMGGCGSMILTFLLLFGVLDVVYKPMTHIVHTPKAKVNDICQESFNVELTSLFVDEINNTAELKGDALKKHEDIVRDAGKILEYYNANLLAEGDTAKDMTLFSSVTAESKLVVSAVVKDSMLKAYEENDKSRLFADTDLYKLTDAENKEMSALATAEEKAAYKAEHAFGEKTRDAINTLHAHFGSYKVSSLDSISFEPTSGLQRELYSLETFGTGSNKDAYDSRIVGEELKVELTELYDNLNFIGIPLGQVPWNNLGWPIILIPILSLVFSLLQTLIQNKQMERTNPEAAGMGSMKIMMWIMPLFSLWLVFTVPAGAGFYWTISYAFGIVQTLVLNKLYSPEKLRAQAEAEYRERMKEVNARGRVVESEDGLYEYKGERLTQKEINRRKLAEARRQDAEKYGEEYNDDDI